MRKALNNSPMEMLNALRSEGWMVAVHNDYRQGGKLHTFWLFTHHSGRYIKGEGKTDEEAIRRAILTTKKGSTV